MTREPGSPAVEPAHRYVPSGRVDVVRFVPLVAAGLIVAAVTAVLLLIADSWLYIYIITPIALGLPVFGMIWTAVRVGRCRNPRVGGFVGVVLAFAYYAGYWELSYLANVASRGPVAVAIVEQVGGQPGLPGYFVYRCKTSRPGQVVQPAGMPNRPLDAYDMWTNGFAIGAEAILVSVIAVGIGRSTASRAYSELMRRWAASTSYLLPEGAAEEAAEAMLTGDWAELAAIPRIPPAAAAAAPVVNLSFEYFPGGFEEPVFITLRGGRKGRAAPGRRRIDGDQVDALARAFRDLDLAPRMDVEASRGAPPATAPEESLGRPGLASPAAEITEPRRRTRVSEDFRDRAVAASLAFLGDAPIPRLATVDASLCLPAPDGGVRRHRRAARAMWAWSILPPVLMFGTMGGFLGLSTLAKGNGPDTLLSEGLAAAGLVGFFAAPLLLIVQGTRGLRAWRGYLARRVGDRPGSPQGESGEPPSTALILEDGSTFHKMKLLGDDFAIVFFDREHRRIIAEGLTHRYVIRAEDVSRIQLVPSTSTAPVHLDWSVGEERLALVLCEVNVWHQIPLGGRMARRVAENHLRRVADTLIGGAPAP